MLDYIPAGKLHDGQPEIIRKKKLQQASSAELQLSSFEVLFWVFHEDMKMFIY